jgi:hypothetical protein
MDSERNWAEVDHNLLLSEPEAKTRSGYNVVDLVVNCLFEVDVWRLDLVDVALDVH